MHDTKYWIYWPQVFTGKWSEHSKLGIWQPQNIRELWNIGLKWYLVLVFFAFQGANT